MPSGVYGSGDQVLSPAIGTHAPSKRPITVEDAVGITRTESLDSSASNSPDGLFSPDGSQFLVVLKKSNIEKNTNDFSLLLYRTVDVFHSPKADLLLKMSSSSSNDGITKVRWLADNETVVFLGENPGEVSQIYGFNIRTRFLAKLTNHPTAIRDYDMTQDGHEIVFVADPSDQKRAETDKSTGEIVVTNQDFIELVTGKYSQPWEMFWQVTGKPQQRVPIGPEYSILGWTISLSPDGRYVVFAVHLRTVPAEWSSYQDPLLQQTLAANFRKGAEVPVREYLVFDIENMSLGSLINAPRIELAPVIWAPDGNSVFLSSYLPLDVTDANERAAREQQKYLVEVKLPGREYKKVSKEDFPSRSIKDRSVKVTLDQDINTPPKLYVSDAKSRRKELLLDLNPQFSELDFGTVKTIEWTVDGVELSAGLYLPPDYLAGRRYPLVIQTHGFEPGEFSMDGRSEWGSAFAARPLAAKGIVVLQFAHFKDHAQIDKAENDRKLGATAGEVVVHFAIHAIEAAIDNLDSQGLIDRNRVGISGFSRWACFAGYILTHSRYRFAAASLVDGISCGYFEEIAVPEEGWDIDNLMGGAPPIGKGLELWIKNSPGFNLDKVQTPVQLAAFGNRSILSAWEWYIGLSLQKKPVDFVYVPNAVHIGITASERMSRPQRLVDWFSFWLQQEEDPDPARHDQYTRWRELRREFATMPSSAQ